MSSTFEQAEDSPDGQGSSDTPSRHTGDGSFPAASSQMSYDNAQDAGVASARPPLGAGSISSRTASSQHMNAIPAGILTPYQTQSGSHSGLPSDNSKHTRDETAKRQRGHSDAKPSVGSTQHDMFAPQSRATPPATQAAARNRYQDRDVLLPRSAVPAATQQSQSRIRQPWGPAKFPSSPSARSTTSNRTTSYSDTLELKRLDSTHSFSDSLEREWRTRSRSRSHMVEADNQPDRRASSAQAERCTVRRQTHAASPQEPARRGPQTLHQQGSDLRASGKTGMYNDAGRLWTASATLDLRQDGNVMQQSVGHSQPDDMEVPRVSPLEDDDYMPREDDDYMPREDVEHYDSAPQNPRASSSPSLASVSPERQVVASQSPNDQSRSLSPDGPADGARPAHGARPTWTAADALYEHQASLLPSIEDDDEVLSSEEDVLARVQDLGTSGLQSRGVPPLPSSDAARSERSSSVDDVVSGDPHPARQEAEDLFGHIADEEDGFSPDEEAPENQNPHRKKQHEQQILVKLLVKDLEIGHGCGEREHAIAGHAHDTIFSADRIRHNSISKTYTNKVPLQPPDNPHTPGLHNQQDIELLGEQAVPNVDHHTIQNGMEGARPPASLTPKHICVHVDDNRNTWGQHVWDIDSWIALPKSFNTLKAGLEVKRYSRVPDIIKSDLHITTPGYRGEENARLPPREIPHLHLGFLRCADHVVVHIFFPHMEFESPKFKGLTEADTALFFDKLFIPSANLTNDVAQHFARDHAAAKFNSLARAKERNNTGVTGSAVGERSLLSVESMKNIDRRMNHQISANPELTKFKDFYLFVDAKNIKTAHKHSHSLYHCMLAFQTHIEEHLDLYEMHSMYFDIGKEFTPSIQQSRATFLEERADVRPHVFLHKTCCLTSTRKTFEKKAFGPTKGVAATWTQSFLRDVSSLTLTPPKRSSAYQCGLRYSQWYNVYKELFDAQKTFPFRHKQFLQLAKGDLVQTLVAKGNRGNAKIAAGLSASYRHSRLRIAHALTKSQDKPYGARLEHRVGLDLFRAMMQKAKRVHDAACACLQTNEDRLPSPGSVVSDTPLTTRRNMTPSSLWAIPSATYMAFLAGNYDKLLRAYETGIRQSDTYISKDRCKVLWVLLLALTEFQSANLKIPNTLWTDEQESAASKKRRKGKRKQNAGPLRPELSGESILPLDDEDVLDSDKDDSDEGLSHGLGLSITIEKYGYGWFLPRIDWKKWMILPEYEKTFLAFFADTQKGKGGHVNVARDTFDTIRMYEKLLEEFKMDREARSILANCFIHAVLRQYRFDVIQHLHQTKTPPNTVTEHEAYDAVVFSWDSITNTFLGTHVPVTKGALFAPDQATMIMWLFGGVGNEASKLRNLNKIGYRTFRRNHFFNSPYRLAYRMVREALHPYIDSGVFEREFQRLFFHFHWVVPYPDAGGSLSGTGKKELMSCARRWWVASECSESVETGPPRRGSPPKPPSYVNYEEEELRQTLRMAMQVQKKRH